MHTLETQNDIDRYLESLRWRYATKKFSDRKISDTTIEQLTDALQLSASSYGLQPYHILVIEDPKIREALKPHCWNQSQITDASHLIVLAHKTDFDEALVDSYLQRVALVRNLNADDLKGYGDFMKSKLVSLSPTHKSEWTAKQAYIALGNLLSAAATLQLDACPMEGFEAQGVNEILDLPSKNLSAAVLVAVGYRSEEDQTQHYAKVRRTKEELFTYL